MGVIVTYLNVRAEQKQAGPYPSQLLKVQNYCYNIGSINHNKIHDTFMNLVNLSGGCTMIIDADCHISATTDEGGINADMLLERMERAQIDHALIWLKPRYRKEIEKENHAIYKAVQSHPGKFYGFGWANPRLGAQAAERDIRQTFEEYNLHGIKFNGAQDEYVIDDDRLALPYIEMAAQYGKPIAFHIGADTYENTHPYRLGHIAARFPEVQFLMVHMGGAGIPSLARAAIETAQAYPNITLIASAIDENAVAKAIHTLGAQRVCFGSDTPFAMMHVRVAMFQALLQDFDPQTAKWVMGDSILTKLGD